MNPHSTDITVYPLTSYQAALLKMLQISLHKNVLNVPLYMTIDQQLDFDLLRRAYVIEIERNDSLRLRFVKGIKGYRQYFASEIPQPEIPIRDFTNASEQEMLDWLQKDAARPLRFIKGENYRFMLFRTPDRHTGIYFNVFHLVMDLMAVYAFFYDLIEIYLALQDQAELPKPLGKFEDAVIHDLALCEDKERQDRDREFFRGLFLNGKKAFYAGVAGTAELEKIRDKRKDPEYNAVPYLNPFRSKSALSMFHIDGDFMNRLSAFCAENQTTLFCVIYLGLRTWLSKINYESDDVILNTVVHRRITRSEKRSGGCRINDLNIRIILEDQLTFKEALDKIRTELVRIYRHSNLISLDMSAILRENNQHGFLYTTESLILSLIPPDILKMPGSWQYSFHGLESGHFAITHYIIMIPCFRDGGLDCYYKRLVYRASEQDMKNLHENMIKVINAGMENPDITLANLLHNVL